MWILNVQLLSYRKIFDICCGKDKCENYPSLHLIKHINENKRRIKINYVVGKYANDFRSKREIIQGGGKNGFFLHSTTH